MRRLLLVCIAAASIASCTTTKDSGPEPTGGTVTVLTHDSFDVSKSVLQQFETASGINVKFVTVGDAGQLANRLILSAGNPEGDVAFGVDNDQLADVLVNDVFTPYESPALSNVPRTYQLDPSNALTPVDHGDVCVDDDVAAYTFGTPAPTTLDDLTDPAYRGQLVVESPATSTPGLAFLLATVAAYGDPGFEDYWQRLRDNDVTVVDGWERAYYGEFSGASGGEGSHPLVVSYSTDPAAEVYFANEPLERAPVGVLTQTCYRQIEFAGILAGTQHEDAARHVIDWLLSPAFQNDIPLRMFVYPVSNAAAVPAVFENYAAVVRSPWSLSPADVAAHRADWVERWASVMGR